MRLNSKNMHQKWLNQPGGEPLGRWEPSCPGRFIARWGELFQNQSITTQSDGPQKRLTTRRLTRLGPPEHPDSAVVKP
ncbi:hypothetical protein ROHU_003630 [Labeo rohita]|uniref:Uncharacterized protein n=1 Tax=Labeo rohita TaxID=84645 RepID=A0A498NU56_LABRO|nr:hypothetical protein ROHU_003630 [Labeo rohita]